MILLGIETSCDETAAAVVEEGRTVHSNVIASSRAAFERSGGVIPEAAARRQIECILPVIDQALDSAKVELGDLEGIAVTYGPGLLGSLLVGTATARVLALTGELPLIGVHHTLGHLSSTWLLPEGSALVSNEPRFPMLSLSASGGHTELWYRTTHTQGALLGTTRDDAAGEAFDKGASLLGLPYPGGPAIARAAEGGDLHAFPFPLPLEGDATLDFSFSGLKTALKYTLRDLGDNGKWKMENGKYADLAASYQHALCRHLLDRIARAAQRHPGIRELHIVGGVSANVRLRELASDFCRERGLVLRVPSSLSYCTDNAAMIAAAGAFLIRERPEQAQQPFHTSASVSLERTLTP